MSYKRYSVDLAFEEPISGGLQGKLNALEVAIRNVKPYAKKINAGKPNEEDTTKGKKHKCHHDSGNTIPCEPAEDI